jgi:peptide/nickel transport system substrate-binding protein
MKQNKGESKMTFLRKLGLAAVLSVLATTAACTKKQANTDFEIGISQEFESLNPMVTTTVASFYTYGFVGRGLVSIDAQGQWYPQMAKAIPSLENGGAKIATVDGQKTIQATWEINEKAQWNDGTPITCADFQFTRNVADNDNVSVGSKEYFTVVKTVEWDPATPQKCLFTYDKLRWDFYQLGHFFPLPKHLEEPIFEKHKNEKQGYEKNSNYVTNPTLPGLYNGPYQVAEVKLGSHVVFVPNSKYYGAAPKISKILLKLIPNTGTLEANLLSGSIDKVASLGFTFDQALAFEKKVKEKNLPYQVLYKPSLVYEHIDLLLENPMLKDVRVRRALIHSINRDELVQALFEGRQPVADHFLASMDPWYSNDPAVVQKYAFDRGLAGKLLDEAGWKMGKDGIRAKDGEKLSLKFMTTAGNKTRETVQTFLQNQWKSVGVDVYMKNEPARVFFGETQKKRQYGGMAMYAWVSTPESSPRQTFHSSNIATEKNAWSGSNVPAWNNKKVDQVIDSLETEFDPKKRKTLAHELLKLYTEDAPVIPLYFRSDVAVIPKNLKNFELTGHEFSESNFVENWKLE